MNIKYLLCARHCIQSLTCGILCNSFILCLFFFFGKAELTEVTYHIDTIKLWRLSPPMGLCLPFQYWSPLPISVPGIWNICNYIPNTCIWNITYLKLSCVSLESWVNYNLMNMAWDITARASLLGLATGQFWANWSPCSEPGSWTDSPIYLSCCCFFSPPFLNHNTVPLSATLNPFWYKAENKLINSQIHLILRATQWGRY